MTSHISAYIKTLSHTKVDVKWFSFFRIAFSSFIIYLVTYLFSHRQIIFNTIPNLSFNPFPAKLFLLIWLLSLLFLLIGLFSKAAAIINYAFVIITVYSFSNSGCGSFNDDLLRIGSFILIFFPVNKTHSVDAFLFSLKYGLQPSKVTSKLNYIAAITISLGLLYFASSLTKLTSPMWLNGLGLWIPSSMPYNKWNNINWHLNQPWLMYFLNYLTVFWELLFLPLLFFKWFKKPIAFIGLLFHLGIAAIFPFPLLCFGPLPFYLLFCAKNESQYTYTHQLTYNANNNSQLVFVRLITALNHRVNAIVTTTETMGFNHRQFDSNKQAALFILNNGGLIEKCMGVIGRLHFFELLFKHISTEIIITTTQPITNTAFINYRIKQQLLIIFSLTLLAVQVFYSSYHLYSKANGAVSMEGVKKFYRIRKDITDYSLKPSNLFRTFFGLNARGVFLDHSNQGTKTVFAIVSINQNTNDTTWLPYFNQEGICQSYNLNLAWSKYTFNSVCSGTIPNPAEVHKTLWFWATKNNQNLNQLNLVILGRTYDFPSSYQPNYLQQQQQKAWKPVATAVFIEGKFNYTLLDSL